MKPCGEGCPVVCDFCISCQKEGLKFTGTGYCTECKRLVNLSHYCQGFDCFNNHKG